jgi:hypothetical protein
MPIYYAREDVMLTNNMQILSEIFDKMMEILDSNGKVKSIKHIPAAIYGNPEKKESECKSET